MTIQGQDSSNAVLGVDLDIPGLWQCQVEDLLVPGQTLLDVHEAEHEGLVPPEGPGVLVELGHQLVLGFPE